MTAIVQSGTGSGASGSAGTILPASCAIGDCVAFLLNIGAGTASVSSPIGTFVAIGSPLSVSGGSLQWWVCTKATGASNSITVTITAGGTWAAQAAYETSGPPIASATDGGNATGTSLSAALTVASPPGGVALVDLLNLTGGSSASSPASPWVVAGSGAAQVTPSGATVTATWTFFSSSNWFTLGLILTPISQAGLMGFFGANHA